MKNRPLVIPEPQAHKELNPSLLIQKFINALNKYLTIYLTLINHFRDRVHKCFK